MNVDLQTGNRLRLGLFFQSQTIIFSVTQTLCLFTQTFCCLQRVWTIGVSDCIAKISNHYGSQMTGESEAAAIEAIGKAEAERMRQKAAAYKMYGDAAMTALILEALPKVTLPPSRSPLYTIFSLVMYRRT